MRSTITSCAGVSQSLTQSARCLWMLSISHLPVAKPLLGCCCRVATSRAGFPALTILIAFGFTVFGPAGNWCWIPVSKRVFQLCLYYLPMVIAFIVSLVRAS